MPPFPRLVCFNIYWTDLHVALVSEVAIQSLASERLKSIRSGSSTSERAIRTHDLEQTFASPFRAPVTRRSREPTRDPFRARSAPLTFQPAPALAGWWASPYLGRKGAIPRERDWTRGQQRGCSPPPKLAGTGWSGLGVWRATRSRGALTSMAGSSADAESGPRAEIMKRSGHGDRTHYIRHHHD